MQTRDIPREQWIKFFDDFSWRHEGWIVTLEVLGPDIGNQEEANNLPLVGISADVKARENQIEIIVGVHAATPASSSNRPSTLAESK